MKRIATRLLLGGVLFSGGCGYAAWTPEQLSSAANDHLCVAHAAKVNLNSWETAAPLLDELVRRGMVREEKKAAVKIGKVEMGMWATEVQCGYGYPSDVNRTVTQYGTREQWVYQTYYGPTLGSTWKFLYFENNILTGWQD